MALCRRLNALAWMMGSVLKNKGFCHPLSLAGGCCLEEVPPGFEPGIKVLQPLS
jgi:hypothetical protein